MAQFSGQGLSCRLPTKPHSVAVSPRRPEFMSSLTLLYLYFVSLDLFSVPQTHHGFSSLDFHMITSFFRVHSFCFLPLGWKGFLFCVSGSEYFSDMLPSLAKIPPPMAFCLSVPSKQPLPSPISQLPRLETSARVMAVQRQEHISMLTCHCICLMRYLIHGWQ